MDSLECARRKIRVAVAGSPVPEDSRHAEDTLEWLLKLDPGADEALRLAALGHDLDRAFPHRKVRRSDYTDYDRFKAAHARNSAALLGNILRNCGVPAAVAEEACRLVARHETGGDPRSDLLKDADAISFFAVNLPSYYRREGPDETRRRCRWGYRRLSPRAREILRGLDFGDGEMREIVNGVIREISLPPAQSPDPDAVVSGSSGVTGSISGQQKAPSR